MKEYLDKIKGVLDFIEETEKDKLKAVAARVCSTICDGGLIYVFGCGHSHLPGLDAFYRAGGLACVSPMLDTDLMLHNGAAKSSAMEKMPGIGSEIFRRYCLQPQDMLIIISASGKNEVPIEVAKCAKEAGIYTVGISSSSYFEKGGKLKDAVTINLDNHVPYGDACIDIGGSVFMGGLSTSASCFILNSVLIEGASLSMQKGCAPPVYISGNVEGGKAHNRELEKLYMGKVKHL